MTVIEFTPGLVPVLKHAQHDQSSHGRKGSSGPSDLTAGIDIAAIDVGYQRGSLITPEQQSARDEAERQLRDRGLVVSEFQGRVTSWKYASVDGVDFVRSEGDGKQHSDPRHQKIIADVVNDVYDKTFPKGTERPSIHMLNDAGGMAVAGNERMQVHPQMFDDAVMSKYMNDWKSGGSVTGSRGGNADDARTGVLTHEIGHIVQHKVDKIPSARDAVNNFINDDSVRPDPRDPDGVKSSGPRWTRDYLYNPEWTAESDIGLRDLFRSVYATESPREWFAEAFTDYVLNGENASSSSKGLMSIVDGALNGVVAKHGTHDQSDHGRRGSGSSTGRRLDPTNEDDVREAFTGTIETRAGTVSVVVDSVDVFDFSTSVQGALIGPDGEYVGQWSRTVTPEIKVMYNESLEIAEKSRKFGVGTEFQKHSEQAALALGMEKIVIRAAMDGKEAWASERFGFDFAGPPSEGLYRAEQLAGPKGLNRPEALKQVKEWQSRFDGPESGWPKPHEILAAQGDPVFRLFTDRPEQVLGSFVLGYGWEGKKPADRVTKQVEPEMFYVTVENYALAGAVAKHGIHNQSSHGNWAHGKGTGSHAGEAKMGPASATDGYGNARTTTYISGNRGETQTPLPEGWLRATEQEHDDYDRAAMRAMMRPEMLEGIEKGSPLEDDYLRAYRSVAASKAQLFAGPNGTGVVVQGEISWRDDFTPEDFVQNLKQISELQRVTPAPGLQVIVGTQEFSKHGFDESTRGFVDTRDVDTMHLRPSALSAGNKYDVEGSRRWDNLMSTSEANRPVYALTHEYGHVVDRRSNESALADFNEVVQSNRGLITGSSPYAREGYFGEGAGGRGLQVGDKPTGREMYAEAWTGWVLSKGWAARNPGMVQFFAEKYGWNSETGTAPMAKAKSKGRIYMDSFGPEGGWVLDSLPGESATVAFAPGLKPVLKHAQHNQSDHGRRGGGSGAGSQDGGAAPVVNDFTDSDGNLAKPMSMRDSDHPDEVITVIPASANPMDGLNVVSIYKGEEQAGVMRYEPYSGKVEWINVEEKFRRQGVATRLWEAGKYVAARHPNMIEPKHSKSQTTEGAAWASVVKFYRSMEINDGMAKHGNHAQLSHGNRSKGIDRTEMPQIPKANREAFLAELTNAGISHKEESVDPRDLRRTQRAIDPVNVKQMHAAMVAGTMKEGLPIIVSSDGRVLDGHHRWAAAAQLADEVPGTTVKITRVDMKMDDLLARARKFNEEQGIAARAIGEVRPVAKHGTHDQKRHGNRGETQTPLPEGWSRVSDDDRIDEMVQRAQGDWAAGMDPTALRAAFAEVAEETEQFAGPNGSTVIVHKVGNVSPEDVRIQLDTLSDLQRIAPVPGVSVTISDGPFEGIEGIAKSTKGYVIFGTTQIFLRPSAVTEGVNHSSGMLMPVLSTQPKKYALTHEYGHVLDQRPAGKASDDKAMVINHHQTGMSRYASADEQLGASGREAFAEAFVGWVGSQGRMADTPGMVQFFANKYGWDSGSVGRSPSAGFAKERGPEFILYDTFTDEGAGVVVISRSSTVAFAPGLKPVLKHGEHDQSSHGRRFASVVSGGLTASIAERVRENGGLSVNVFDGSEPSSGFMVARGRGKGAIVPADEFYDPERGPAHLSAFLQKYRSDLTGGAYLGLWHNKEDGNVYLDVSDQIADRGQAEKLGSPKFRNQISIWDVANFAEIKTGGTGELAKGALNVGVIIADRGTAEFVYGDGQGDRGVRREVVGQVHGGVAIGFAPGLVPVLKHGTTHNEADHGRRRGSSSAAAAQEETKGEVAYLLREGRWLDEQLSRDGMALPPPPGVLDYMAKAANRIEEWVDRRVNPSLESLPKAEIAQIVMANRARVDASRAARGLSPMQWPEWDGGSVQKADADVVDILRRLFAGEVDDRLFQLMKRDERPLVERDGPFADLLDVMLNAVARVAGDEAVVKHEQHNQKDHGRRGSGGQGSTGVEAIPEDLRKIFDYAVGRIKPLNSDEQQVADDLLLDTARGWASQNGYPADDAPHDGLSSATIYGGAVVRRAMDLRDQEEKWAKTSDEDADKVKAVFDEWRENGQVMISVPSDYLDDILRDGVKNQFDTGESGGLLHNDNRAVDEAAHHGIRPDAPGEDRPVYGYIGRPGGEHPIAVHNYGDVTLVLKDSARGRTTVTLGDSLNTNTTPVPLDGKVTPRQVSDASARTIFSDDFRLTANNGSKSLAQGAMYMEAQIMGGVRREDISRIVFGPNADIDVEGGGVGMLANEMRPYGISVDVMDGY